MVAASSQRVEAALEPWLHNDLMDRATFICGHPKSGTSLVLTLLDSHPELIVYPEESGYFRRFESQAAGLHSEARLTKAEELILRIFHWNPADPHPSQDGFPDRDYSIVDFDQVRRGFRLLAADRADDPSAILPAAILAYGAASGLLSPNACRWVEKTPYNERFAARIYELWPQAKCIHIVRDPRDNYASYRRKHPDWSEWTFARSWQQSLVQGLQNRQKYGEAQYLIARYEDLIANPEETLARLAEFLGIHMHGSLRSPTRSGIPWGGNSMFGEQFEGISTTPLGRYAQDLSRTATRRLELALHPWMRQLSYQPDAPIALVDRALGWAIRGTWRAMSLGPAAIAREQASDD